MMFPFANSYSKLPDGFFTRTNPSPVSDPALIQLNSDLAEHLGADVNALKTSEGLAILAGNAIAEGSEPIAMAYAGHQFGGFVPQLGDGRAIVLGEVIDKDGVRRDIQLKGSGPTPFSRRADGRSALGPVLREYIVSEAMAALGVPTTRALAAVTSGDQVIRERITPGGVFTRVARSLVRVGTFEWFAAREEQDNLQILADYVIDRHYPDAKTSDNPYLTLLENVIQRQAQLIAHWMQVGFIHGVMNTDNMNVSGETIDYGPCAFLDEYHPTKKFSSIDQQGRYAFGNQASIGHWNLSRLAETLLPLIHSDKDEAISLAESALKQFAGIYQSALQNRFTGKIGITDSSPDDWKLVEDLLEKMAYEDADFTLVFRHLSDVLESGDDQLLTGMFKRPESISGWLASWRARIKSGNKDEAIALMRKSNPIFIPRNHRIEEAIAAGYTGDFAPFHRLNKILQHPFKAQPEHKEFENAPEPEEVVQATFCGT